MKGTSSSLSSAPNLRDRDKEAQHSGSFKALASEKLFSHHEVYKSIQNFKTDSFVDFLFKREINFGQNTNGVLSNPLPPLAGGHIQYENGSNGKVSTSRYMGIIILPTCIRLFRFPLFISRSRAHSSESIDTRGATEVLEHQPFVSGVQPLQHMGTPSSTPHGTPHGTPSGFTIDGHSRKIKASSRRPLKQSTEYHIPREKEDQSKLEPVKQVLFPIGSAVEPSEENIPTQLKKMPALISLTTSPTYTALSLNSTTVSTTSTPTAGPGKKSSGGDRRDRYLRNRSLSNA